MAKFDFIHQQSLLLEWYTDSNTSLTIQCLFCRTVCLWPQNTPQFPISLHLSQISLLRTFFWGLQTASSHWGPDLENGVGAEAIWSAIRIVLPSFRSTYDTVHCLGERALFSSFVAVFWLFLPPNTPIMLYNIHYWWFFLFQGNQWTKYVAHPKIQRPKPACWCWRLWSLWMTFTYCCPLSWLSIWLRSKAVVPCFLHCHIFMQKLLLVALKVANNTLNRRRVVVFDRL